MEKDLELETGSDGHEEIEGETQEQLNSAYKKLTDLAGGGTSMVTLTKQDLSLMKQILTAASEEYKEQIMWRMCDFIDEDEALDHVAAYFEAKDLGMDTGFNVAFMFALVSANRRRSAKERPSGAELLRFGQPGSSSTTGSKAEQSAKPPLARASRSHASRAAASWARTMRDPAARARSGRVRQSPSSSLRRHRPRSQG